MRAKHSGRLSSGRRRNHPISGEIPSLGSLTLAGDFPSGRDASVLAAADPDASGYEATQIVTSCGGIV